MSVHLGTLYHWSPKCNRKGILQNGLRIMENALGYSEEELEEFGLQEPPRYPWICLGTSPQQAWSLLPVRPDSHPDCFEHPWDLWQVHLRHGDHVTIQPFDVPRIREVRVHHGLPADRIWWVAERDFGPHITMDEA